MGAHAALHKTSPPDGSPRDNDENEDTHMADVDDEAPNVPSETNELQRLRDENARLNQRVGWRM